MPEPELPRPRWTFGKIIGRGLGLVAIAWLAWQIWPVWLEPGPKTTVITEPRRPDGTIDYAAALNVECSIGVTPVNNAVVLLVQALGPGIFDATLVPEYFQELGIENLPADGTYLRSMEEMFPDARDRQLRIWDEFEAASTKPWSDEDYPDLAQWLTVNEEPLKLCIDATKRERFYDPLIRPPGGSLLETLYPVVQESRSISRLLSLRAMQHLQQGNIDAALADSEAMHRLSRLVARHPLQIPRLVAYAHASMAAAVDGVIIGSGELSAEQARRHRTFLQSLPAMPNPVQTVDHGERFVTLDLIQVQFMGPKPNIGWVQPNAFLETTNEGIDKIVAAMQQPDWPTQQTAIEAAVLDLRALSKVDANDMGRIVVNPRRNIPTQLARLMISLTAPVAKQSVSAAHRTDVRHQMAIAGFALTEYRAVHGSYPDTLDPLVPDYLSSIPTDPFTGQLIRYAHNADRNSILLYSLGENGVDDHGLRSGRNKADDTGFGDVPTEE